MDQFRRKLSEAWSFATPHRLLLPDRFSHLDDWAAPSLVNDAHGEVRLNWEVWLPHVESAPRQAAGLASLMRDDEPSFLLWRRADSARGTRDPRVREVPEGVSRQSLLRKLSSFRFSHSLRNEASTPPESKAKIETASVTDVEEVYALGEEGEEDACLVLGNESSLLSSFASPSSAERKLQSLRTRTSSTGKVIFVQVLIGNRCQHRRSATALIEHAMSMHVDHLFVVHAPVSVSALSFWAGMGYRYDDMKAGSENLLPHIVDRLSLATCAWHSGRPEYTYLRPHIHDSKTRIGTFRTSSLPQEMGKEVCVLKVEDADTLEGRLRECILNLHAQAWVWVPDEVASVSFLQDVLHVTEHVLHDLPVDFQIEVLVHERYGTDLQAAFDSTPSLPRTQCVWSLPWAETTTQEVSAEEEEEEEEEEEDDSQTRHAQSRQDS